jgi:hypothetical protein
MVPLEYFDVSYAKLHNEELLKQAAQSRLLYEAKRSISAKPKASAWILTQIEKELSILVARFQMRFGLNAKHQAEVIARLNRVSLPGKATE